jgi:Protein of unknown function (DUF3500)
MRINELIAAITNDWNAFGEWPYFISIFGIPGPDSPWGFQFDGHHVAVNVMIVDRHIVSTPMFLGAEPRRVLHVRSQGRTCSSRRRPSVCTSFDPSTPTSNRAPSSTPRFTPMISTRISRTCSMGACRQAHFTTTALLHIRVCRVAR